MCHIEVLPDSQLAPTQSCIRANVIKLIHRESNSWALGEPELREKRIKRTEKGKEVCKSYPPYSFAHLKMKLILSREVLVHLTDRLGIIC